MDHFVYMVCCRDETLYTGYTTNPHHRILAHNQKKGARYTRSRTPVVLVYLEKHAEKSMAMHREYEIKQLGRRQKEALIESDANLCQKSCPASVKSGKEEIVVLEWWKP